MKAWMDSLHDHAVDTIRYICRVIVLSVCLAGVILIGMDLMKYLFQSREFVIRNVEIVGNSRVHNEEIILRAAIAPSSNIWLLDLNAIHKRVEDHPAIEDVVVLRVPPHKVQITITERSPIAFIENSTTHQLHGIDRKGYILEPMLGPEMVNQDENTRMEQIRYVQSAPLLGGEIDTAVVPGTPIQDAHIRSGLRLIETIRQQSPSLYASLDEMAWLDDGNVKLIPDSHIGVIVLRELESPNLARKLAAFWRHLQEHDVQAMYVDARFPSLGFAVRWDPQQGERWKNLYRLPRSITYVGH